MINVNLTIIFFITDEAGKFIAQNLCKTLHLPVRKSRLPEAPAIGIQLH